MHKTCPRALTEAWAQLQCLKHRNTDYHTAKNERYVDGREKVSLTAHFMRRASCPTCKSSILVCLTRICTYDSHMHIKWPGRATANRTAVASEEKSEENTFHLSMWNKNLNLLGGVCIACGLLSILFSES